MKPIALTPAMQTGDPTVDAQHRALIAIANEILRDDALDGRTCLKGLAFLSRYAGYHFAAEEEAMERTGYPDAENHRQHHARMTERISEIARQFDDYGARPEVRAAFRDLLDEWVSFHLSVLDRHLVQHMQGRGENVHAAPDPDGDLAAAEAAVADGPRTDGDAEPEGLGARLRRLWQRVTASAG